MLFNSIDFALFIPIVFILYWFVFNRHLRRQNLFIVAASYFFYSCWDWRFLFLILLSTIVDYVIGILLSKQYRSNIRKLLLVTSIVVNLGIFGFFKYFNFFIDSFSDVFLFLGLNIKSAPLNIILPVGISFYTFQTLSYTIDVYKQKLIPTKDFISFASFVCFFPQLVAGPIEKASNLLPQFYKKRHFHYASAVDGTRQILWGLFKKVVIADSCAQYVNIIFDNYQDYSGSTLLLGAILFAFQIYGDFSGYSDIAIGTSRLFGFNLKQNFAYPYFSRDIAEFWRRWHISLSTWFKDYLYIPLGGSRLGKYTTVRNVLIVFLISGFWHGANWTFIFWGLINAIFFFPLLIMGKNRNHIETIAVHTKFPSLKEFLLILKTFFLTVFAWIFFRAESINQAFNYIKEILSSSIFSIPEYFPKTLIVLIGLFLILEWFGRDKKFALENLELRWSVMPRYTLYTILFFLILILNREQEFIYFQF